MDGNLGPALIRDAFDTLLRYRGTALNELWRALRLLKALQAQALHDAAADPDRHPTEIPNEPESRRIPGEIAPVRSQTNPAPRLTAITGRRDG